MSTPSNGITAAVIRDVMPHYHLNTDLLGETLRVLPRPPPDASTPWRHARITRLVQEIGGLMPADAPQARIGAQLVIVREVADDSFRRSSAPGLTIGQVCQLRRIGADLAVIDHTPDDTDFELVRIRHADRPSLPLLQGQIGLRQIGNLPCFTAASIPVDPRVAERHEP